MWRLKLTRISCMIRDRDRPFNSRLPVIFHRQSPVLWWGHVALPKGLFASIQRRLLPLHIYLWRPPRLVSLLHTEHPIPAAVRYWKSKSCCFNFFLFFKPIWVFIVIDDWQVIAYFTCAADRLVVALKCQYIAPNIELPRQHPSRCLFFCLSLIVFSTIHSYFSL